MTDNRVERWAALRRAGWSLRRIAKAEGVGHVSVKRALDAAGVDIATVVGRDGKRYSVDARAGIERPPLPVRPPRHAKKDALSPRTRKRKPASRVVVDEDVWWKFDHHLRTTERDADQPGDVRQAAEHLIG